MIQNFENLVSKFEQLNLLKMCKKIEIKKIKYFLDSQLLIFLNILRIYARFRKLNFTLYI